VSQMYPEGPQMCPKCVQRALKCAIHICVSGDTFEGPQPRMTQIERPENDIDDEDDVDDEDMYDVSIWNCTVYTHTHIYICVLVDIFEGMTHDEDLSMTLISKIHMTSAFEVAMCIHTHIHTYIYTCFGYTCGGIWSCTVYAHIYICVSIDALESMHT